MGTQRDKATLDVAFADNTTRDITPSMLRDFVESCLPSRALLTFASASSPIAAVSTPVKAANVTTLEHAHRFSMPANNRLRYDGPELVNAEVRAVLGISADADAQVVRVSLAKNGAVVAGTEFSVLLGATGALSQVSLLARLDVDATDYLEVFVSNETSDEDVTIDHGSLGATAFLT